MARIASVGFLPNKTLMSLASIT